MLKINLKIKTWKFWRPIVGASIGALVGFAYYYFIGCSTNSCPITSNPYSSIVIGALAGFIIAK